MNFKRTRVFRHPMIRNAAVLLVLAQAVGLQVTRNARKVHADSATVTLNLSAARQFQTVYQGSPHALQAMGPGRVSPLSMATGDFDVDGIGDLAVGFAAPQGSGMIAIHRGNLDAYAPQSAASFQAISRGEVLPPYLPQAAVVDVPERPDFLTAGDVFGQNGPGVIAAARGGSKMYVVARGSSGKMEVVQSIPSGAITALSAHQLLPGKYAQVVVGAHGPNGPELDVYSGSNEGLSKVSSFALASDATAFASGNLDGDTSPDVLVLAGGALSILHGGSQTLEPVRVPYTVSSAVLGRFLFDRGGLAQMALLATDGSVHILAQDSLDSRPFTADEARALKLATHHPSAQPLPSQREVSWKEMESYPAAGAVDASGKLPAMFRTRITNNGADDIMLWNAARLSLVVHTDLNPSSGVVIDRPDLGVNAAAAAPVRVNFDSRPGLVYVKSGQTVPFIQAASSTTFFPNEFDDPAAPLNLSTVCKNTSNADMSSACSLREAVLKASADSGNTDTVMLAAGNYTLSRAKLPGDYSGFNGALYINNSMNIVGTGQGSTFIAGGPSAGAGVDMVMAVNEDISPTTNSSATISNLTIEFGTNQGTIADGNSDQDGGGMEFDTGTSGNATLTMINVTLSHNQTTDGFGGGIALFDFLVQPASGQAIFTNCIFDSNSVHGVGGDGSQAGAIWASITNSVPALFTMTNTQVTNNQSTGAGGAGGAIEINGPSGANPQSAIHASLISGNSTSGQGGAIYTTSGVVIDTGTIISNNTATGDGGGIWTNSSDTSTWSNVTFTANHSSGNGGGIHVDAFGGPVNISFSRIAGNTATGTGHDLDNSTNLSNPPGTAVTAQHNWWGTNTPGSPGISPSTSNCPAAGFQICFAPYLVLGLTANPTTVMINTTSQLTASFLTDSGLNPVAASDLGVLTGVPITFPNPLLGNITSSDSVIENQQAISSASEIGTTATITTSAPHNFSSGQTVTIAGVSPIGYNGEFTITSTTSTTFTYVDPTSGLGAGSGGTASVPAGIGTAVYTAGGTGGNGQASAKVDNATVNVAITVVQPPTISKAFNPATVTPGQKSTITFSLNNPNTIAIDANFTDTLPAGLTVASTPNVVNTCGGTVTATAGTGTISFTNATWAGGACTISVDLTAPGTDGVLSNNVTLNSTAAGNSTQASANLTVIAPPAIAKAFGALTIPLGTTTSLTFTLSSSNSSLTLNGVSFTDSLPAGLVVASTPNLNSTCSGVASAPGGGSSVTLTGATLTPGASCTVSVNVNGSIAGAKNNTVSVSSTNGGNGVNSNASVTVIASPSIAKAFNPTSIAAGSTTTLTFTITNPGANAMSLTGVAFTDTLPAGLTVANGSSPICGGTLTTTNPTTITLSGATIAANAQCIFPVTVTGASAGPYTNVTGAVTSTNGGTGNTASAGLTVTSAVDLTIAMTHAGNFAQNQLGDAFYLSVSNVGSASTDGSTVTVTDTLPVGFTATTIFGSGWNCTLGTLTCTRNDVLGASASYPMITIFVNIASDAGPSLTNTATVSGGGDATPGNDTASNTVAIAQTSSETLTGAISSKTGAQNARVWVVTVANTAASAAAGAQITGITLTQIGGAACTPVINTAFPIALGTIAASGGTASGSVTLDFTGCSAIARFRVTAQFSANAGANTGSMTLNNQFR